MSSYTITVDQETHALIHRIAAKLGLTAGRLVGYWAANHDHTIDPEQMPNLPPRKIPGRRKKWFHGQPRDEEMEAESDDPASEFNADVSIIVNGVANVVAQLVTGMNDHTRDELIALLERAWTLLGQGHKSRNLT